MVAKLRRLGRLYLLYARMDLNWLMQDTWICLVVIFSEMIGALAGVSGLFLLSIRFAGIGGLGTDEMLFLLALSLLGEGIMFCFCTGFNTGIISRRLGRGQLDHMLIQPIPLWMQLLAESFVPFSGNSTLLCGIALMAYTLRRLAMPLTVGWWGLLAFFLLTRAILTIALNYIVGVSAVYQPVACEEVSSVMMDLNVTLCRFPLAGLPAPLMLLLETVLPVALMTYIPALVLLGRATDLLSLFAPLLASAFFSAVAAYLFRKGLNHYAKVGSFRYRSMGYRN